MKDEAIIKELLGDEYAQRIIEELDLQNDPPEAQAEFISLLGENIIQRIVLEVLKILPQSEHEAFEAFMGKNDMDGLRAFLVPHIPEFDRFVFEEAQKEYEETKTRIHQMAQGM